MSTTKYLTSFFFLIIMLLCDLTGHIDAVPLPKATRNVTRATFPNITRMRGSQQALTKPMVRNPRFFGKISFLAGLGLPDAVRPTITRNDILTNDRSPTRYSLSYNFPPRKWGPYVAAVSGNTHTVTNPTNLVVESIAPDKSQGGDVLVLVQEPNNEISNEDRNDIIEKIEVKMEPENHNDARLQTTMNTEPSYTKRNDATTNYVTIGDDLRNADLIAEETTIKLFEEIQMEDEQDSQRAKPSTRKMKKHNVTTTSRTTTTMSSKVMPASPGSNNVTTEMTTIGFNDPTNTLDLNSTQHNNSYTYYNNGYYYQGHPQNVSNIEFTTQSTITNSFIPVRYHNFNEINRFLQQYPTSYYDFPESQPQESFDHHNNRFEQLPPKINEYSSRKIEYLPSNDNTFFLNGFKPSFPVRL
ncbi:PREDICTED: uncharacterized protein LOC105367428 isoform X2 [Ceratosolen solmsi marchali]|uniref:Uncharacterized protein LOC105367428 isoform X2 n=1 Tax=Ceratosolen solmsi marchali TaxID=326594 RepID=A0AAJ6YU19_9HYME|nr:PREDICTED: uncharacterized protein LOC105367428 isoform X2 [Ceratosolen solmsi marchali]